MRAFEAREYGFEESLGLNTAPELAQADLFIADLMGTPMVRHRQPGRAVSLPPAPAVVEHAPTEGIPMLGRGRFRHDALGGDAGDNVEARWNVDASTAAGSTIDIVVYLHGHGRHNERTGQDFLASKAARAGLDLVDNNGDVRVRASRPTLALVPRGRCAGKRKDKWYFDRLSSKKAFDELVAAAISWLCEEVLRRPRKSALARGRLTLMAHSGGGAGLSKLLESGLDPDEVVCFDSLYGGEGPVIAWAKARIASQQAAASGLRAFYTACSAPRYPAGRWVPSASQLVYQSPLPWVYSNRKHRWSLNSTEVSARRLQHAIGRALSGAMNGPTLARRFRVERTSVRHGDIPARYSPLLLEDIAAAVPSASAPPRVTSRPACVANDDWLIDPPRKPGGDDPPPPRPSTAAESAVIVEDVYAPPDARAYTPSASAVLFRTAPTPVAVMPATQWPEATPDPDLASERALSALGVDAAGVAAYRGRGLAALRPISSLFGEAALTELLRRLRYSPLQLARPPHSYESDTAMTRAFGREVRAALLAIRTLLVIPGHFRELARQAGTDQEAYAAENLGWLLMRSLRDEVRTATGLAFWLPELPMFVTPFANPLPGLSPQATRLIVGRMLIDTTIDSTAYRAHYTGWQTGPAGRMWRLETGRERAAGRPLGAPFYSEPFTIPGSIDIARQRAQVRTAWARRVAEFDARTTTVPLTQCDNSYLTSLRLMSRISLRSLQLRRHFPATVTAPALTSLTGLATVRPAFEATFEAIADLGWNDLIFETQGMGCFRGKKVAGNPAAARSMSEHSLGIAIDLNAFENVQKTPGSMDPRIVALFEAFRFRWGRGFPSPDPMHFEYAG